MARNINDHDTIREVLSRNQHVKRNAHGDVDDEEVFVVAEVNERDRPVLHVHGGGRLERYEDELLDEYVDGIYVKRSFDRVDQLDTAFAALVEKYDLTEYDTGDGDDVT